MYSLHLRLLRPQQGILRPRLSTNPTARTFLDQSHYPPPRSLLTLLAALEARHTPNTYSPAPRAPRPRRQSRTAPAADDGPTRPARPRHGVKPQQHGYEHLREPGLLALIALDGIHSPLPTEQPLQPRRLSVSCAHGSDVPPDSRGRPPGSWRRRPLLSSPLLR